MSVHLWKTITCRRPSLLIFFLFISYGYTEKIRFSDVICYGIVLFWLEYYEWIISFTKFTLPFFQCTRLYCRGLTCVQFKMSSISQPGCLYHPIPTQYEHFWVSQKISISTINSTFYNYERKQEKRVNHEWIKNLLVDFCHSHARMRAVRLLKSFFSFHLHWHPTDACTQKCRKILSQV